MKGECLLPYEYKEVPVLYFEASISQFLSLTSIFKITPTHGYEFQVFFTWSVVAMFHFIMMFYTPPPLVLSTNIRNQAYNSHLDNKCLFNPLKK